MKKYIGMTLIGAIVLSYNYSYSAREHHGAAKTNDQAYVTLGATGSKNWINDELYFTYHFDKKPAIGMVIVRIQVYDKEGKRITSLHITGNSGMPSMSGAHDSGEMAFKLNKKGVFLLPVNVVMPGDWEVKFRIKRGNTVIYAGKILFNV